jgi:hypothetical protein
MLIESYGSDANSRTPDELLDRYLERLPETTDMGPLATAWCDGSRFG